MQFSQLRRRSFITLLGGAAAWPLVARAQQTDQVRRIGFLPGGGLERDAEWQAFVAAFKEGLQKLGWIDGHNVRIELRWAGADADRRRAYAAELVNLKPDVIIAGGTSSLTSLSQATRTIPIVFAQVSDPVRAGFVESLVRPGGQHYRLRALRIRDRGEMAGTAQADRAPRHPRGRHLRPNGHG